MTGLLEVGTVLVPPFEDEKTTPPSPVETAEADDGVDAAATVVEVETPGGVVDGVTVPLALELP